jgi:hypothetical protein
MIKQLIHKITKGLITDIDKSVIPNDSAFRMVNWQITSSGKDYVLTSMKGNRFQFSLPKGLLPISFYEYDDILYIISKKGEAYEVGSYPSPALVSVENPIPGDGVDQISEFIECFEYAEDVSLDDVYRPLPMGVKEVSGTKYILGLASKELSFNDEYVNIISKRAHDGSIDLYCCDGVNYNRAINSGYTGSKIALNRFPEFDNTGRNIDVLTRQFLNINKPVYSEYEVKSGGSLRYGRLVFYLRYLDSSFNTTNFIPIEGPVQISYGNNYLNIHGGDPENDILTDKLVRFELKNLDTAFKYFQIGVFYERGLSSDLDPVKKAYLIGSRYEILSSEMNLEITGSEDEEIITPEELINPANELTISLSQSIQNNRWYGANWKRKEFDPSFLENFAKRCYLIPYLSDEVINGDADNSINGSLYGYKDGFETQWKQDAFLSEGCGSNNLLRHQDYKLPNTAMPGEVVSYAIVALMDDGTYSKPYYITGFKNYYRRADYSYAIHPYNLEREIYESGTFFDYNERMINYLDDDSTTNYGLFQYPMFNTSLHDPYETQLHKYALTNANRLLGAKLRMKYAMEYYQEHLNEFKNIKAFYLVKNDDFRNMEYMGVALEAKCRFRIYRGYHEGPPAYDNDHYIYFGKPSDHLSFNEQIWSPEGTVKKAVNMGLRDSAISFPLSRDEKAMFLGVVSADDYYIPHDDTEFSEEASADDYYMPYDDTEVRKYKAKTNHNEKGILGLYSDDFIFSSRRKLTDSGEYYISRIASTKSVHVLPTTTPYYLIKVATPYNGIWDSGFLVVPAVPEYLSLSRDYTTLKGQIFYIDSNVSVKDKFSSAFGDYLYSNDKSPLIFEPEMEENDLLDFSVRNGDLRTSPYIGIKLPDVTSENGHRNQILTIHKENPRDIYSKMIQIFENKTYLNYQLASKSLVVSNSNQLFYNGNLVPMQNEELFYDVTDQRTVTLFPGNAFLTRSYIKTKFTELFKDFNYEQLREESILARPTDVSEYIALSSELMSFPTYTWNNISMHSNRKHLYPMNAYKDKVMSIVMGLNREEDELGFEKSLDATYNRSCPPNNFLSYPDKYLRFNFPHRVTYTAKDDSEGYVDPWRSLPSIQYRDYDASLGFITGILQVLTDLYIIFETGIIEIYSDKREVQASTTGTELTIGVGDVLESTYRVVSREYGSQHPKFINTGRTAYGIDYQKNILWSIGNVTVGNQQFVQSTDLSLSKGISSRVKEAKELVSSIGDHTDTFGSKLVLGYHAELKRAYIGLYSRKYTTFSAVRNGGLYSIYTDNPELMERTSFYLRVIEDSVVNDYILIDVLEENVYSDHVDIELPGRYPDEVIVMIFNGNGKMFIYDEKINVYYESDSVPDYLITGENMRSLYINPDNEFSERTIYVHDEQSNSCEYYGIRHHAILSIIQNGAGNEGLNTVQKMFMSSLIISSENPFFKVMYQTEFQYSLLFPFIDENRFWLLPEYTENKWEFNHPLQISPEDEGYEEEAIMRGIWMIMELHYRGVSQKYINEIINKVQISIS